MSLTEPHMDIPLSSSLSLNDLPIHCPRSDLGRTMSLPYLKQRLQAFRRDSIKRRNIARDNGITFQLGDDPAPSSVALPAANEITGQSPVIAVRRSPSQNRKRYLVQQWLSQQSKRFGRVSRRYDSVVLSPEDIQKELKLLSNDATRSVAGPDGESLPAWVIDDFFKLHSAGGSGWQESGLWEAHLGKWEHHKQYCIKCDRSYCRAMRKTEHTPPLPCVALLPPTSHTCSALNQNPRKKPSESDDVHFTVSIWRRGSRRRRDKGKEPALDQEWCNPLDELLISPCTQAPDRPRAPRTPRNGIVIQEAIQCQRRKPVRCLFSTTPLDPCQIPVPAIPDLYPEDSGTLDLSGPSHVTGRPYGASLLQGKRLPFPLCINLLPPPTPQLKPEQRLTPIPEPLKLEDPLQLSANRELFDIPPITKVSRGATKVQRGGFLGQVNASSTNPYSLVDILPNPHNSSAPLHCSQTHKPIHSSPKSGESLPTSPDSQCNSGVGDIPDLSFGATDPLPTRSTRPTRIPTGSADRDRRNCTLSDTTGSSLPDCPVYMNALEARNRKNERMAKRHWPGMCIWRYRCDDEDE
ncbi:uncharacterized protein M421DRAFT_89543 [Didymella exigua CBS 183.55]|uniref:Uncharacterized protein n=1 Tax=Didymella exigua CBS 183.55 TaxID=1150837 RepID=A0A6A5RYV4_9PLEO|nr:uncharacterized protein M421DRAFT_89543 [Didymella exigua CBS 183.55]KAF1932198.1 hypothetical protein M421DRAFT_89543 [Didymella exigua CBS 183.55]